MKTDPLVVNELRERFKAGATPSALVRIVAERYQDEPSVDVLVRVYFREAFLVPMLLIGKEQVEEVARGGGAVALNSRYVHRMVAARSEWDKPAVGDGAPQPSWLDAVTATDESVLLKQVEAGTLPEAARWWNQIDEQGQRFITRVIANARVLHERVQILATLAEQLQQQLLAAEGAGARER